MKSGTKLRMFRYTIGMNGLVGDVNVQGGVIIDAPSEFAWMLGRYFAEILPHADNVLVRSVDESNGE